MMKFESIFYKLYNMIIEANLNDQEIYKSIIHFSSFNNTKLTTIPHMVLTTK